MTDTAGTRRRMRRHGPWLVLGLVGALLLGACTGGGDEDPTEPEATADEAMTSPATAGPTTVTTSIAEPGTLVPADATTTSDLAVVRALFTGLVRYDPDTGEAAPAVAEAIESDDGRTWEVVLEEGWTFHDGTPVTAGSFVDAWNHAAYGPNRTSNRTAFADIQGFGALQCATREATQEEVDAGVAEQVGEALPNCDERAPTSRELAGLQVTSATEFTVTLTDPQAGWPQTLGLPAFLPLPESFFENPDAFRRAPVGNGPFAFEAWTDEAITTVAHEAYAGTPSPSVAGLVFRIHDDPDAALDALYASEVDLLADVPPERWPEARARVANTATPAATSLNYLGFPLYDDTFADADLRAALSMAIDRELLTEALFDGLRAPATGLLAPPIPGHAEDAVCPAWTFAPERARQRFDDAGGIDGTLTIWLNEGRGHRPWLEAVVGQWSQHLGIDASEVEFEERPFDEHLQLAAEQGFTGPFRLGWEPTVPHPQDVLQPLLDSRLPASQGANATGYADDDVDTALDEATAATDLDRALTQHREAAEAACEDVPIVPLFFGRHALAWNEGIDEVVVDPFGTPDWAAMTVD